MTSRQTVEHESNEHSASVELSPSASSGIAEAFALLLLTSAVVVVILVVASGFAGA